MSIETKDLINQLDDFIEKHGSNKAIDMELDDSDDDLDHLIDDKLKLAEKIIGSEEREEIEEESESSSVGGEHSPITDEEKVDFIETDGDDQQQSISHPPELVRGWKDWFTEHPNRVKQTYGEHLLDSWKFGLISLSSFIFFFIHGLFPFMFEFTGSDWVIDLAQHLTEKRKLLGLDRN